MNDNDFSSEKEIYEDMQKELELEVEKERLEYTKDIIKTEILNYISKRKNVGEFILEYRKNILDEFRDDEDKVTEYFDHEKFVKEEAFKTIDKRLKELIILENSPYFGRVDFSEDDSDYSETMYVGRFGVTPENTYEPVVVDWRAPIAALFYTGKLGKATYKPPMGEIEAEVLAKRQFIIKKGKLQGMFDSAVDVKDDILQMVLSANSSEKLKDIIMTIQEEQDNIIRQPREKTMVVNGVAGSGKTTIALHRVAYLLYNYRDKLQDKVLIFGPNNIFMEYISMVLPSLGEVGVKQRTFNDYAMDLLEIENIMPFKDYMEKIISKDENFIEDILYKNSEEFIEILNNKINELDKEFFNIRDVYLNGELVINSDEISELFQKHYSNMPLMRRSKKIKRIIFSKIKDVRDDQVREVQRKFREKIASMSKADVEINQGHLEFMRRNSIRDIVRGVLNAKEEMAWINNPSLIEVYSNINGNKELIYDDLAPLLYLKMKLEGNVKKEDIRHVVIDEAQDYSALQFKVIKELTGCQSMTVVGDANQRLIPYKGKVPMTHLENILPELQVEHFKLEKSYRSTREIMEYANKFISDSNIVPLVRSGSPIEKIDCISDTSFNEILKDLIGRLKNKGYESIAVVCRDMETVRAAARKVKSDMPIKVVDDENLIYSGGVVLIPSYYAKGLEFDSVIVLNDKTEYDDSAEDRINYVMCTRALHELIIINM